MTCEPEQILICTDKATIIKRERFPICREPQLCCRDCPYKNECKFVCPSVLSKGHDH